MHASGASGGRRLQGHESTGRSRENPCGLHVCDDGPDIRGNFRCEGSRRCSGCSNGSEASAWQRNEDEMRRAGQFRLDRRRWTRLPSLLRFVAGFAVALAIVPASAWPQPPYTSPFGPGFKAQIGTAYIECHIWRGSLSCLDWKTPLPAGAHCSFGGAIAEVKLFPSSAAILTYTCIDEAYHSWTALTAGRTFRSGPFTCTNAGQLLRCSNGIYTFELGAAGEVRLVGPPARYVALGDSYSSGEGLGAYSWSSSRPNNRCHRSRHAYGPLLDAARRLGSFAFVACSGAITADLVTRNHEGNTDPNTGRLEGAQLRALGPSTRIVTLTIGGNDVGFEELATHCLMGVVLQVVVWPRGGCALDVGFGMTIRKRLDALGGHGGASTPSGVPIWSVRSLLQTAHRSAPSAHIYVAGYPRPFGQFRGECSVGTLYAGHVSVQMKVQVLDAQWLNRVVTQLDDTIKAAARKVSGAQITFVDPNAAFSTHRLCDTASSWFNPVSGTADLKAMRASPDPSTFHPTINGQKQGYMSAFLATPIGR